MRLKVNKKGGRKTDVKDQFKAIQKEGKKEIQHMIRVSIFMDQLINMERSKFFTVIQSTTHFLHLERVSDINSKVWRSNTEK